MFRNLYKKLIYLLIFLLLNTSVFAIDDHNNNSTEDRQNTSSAYFDEHYQKALTLLHKNQYEDSLKEFETALLYDPQNPDILFGLGICLYQLRAFTEAYKAYDKALFYYPSPALKAQARSGLGDIYLQLGEYEEAIKQYQLVLLQNPKWLGVHLNLGRAWLKKGEYEKAKKEVKIILEIDPSLGEAYLLSSLIHLEKLDFVLALKNLEKASKLISPLSKELCYQLNRLYRLNHRYEEGVNLIESFIKTEQDKNITDEAYNILGDSFFEWYQYLLQKMALKGVYPPDKLQEDKILQSALDSFKRAVLIHPDDGNLRYKLAEVYKIWGDIQSAKNSLKQAILLKPQNLSAALKFIRVLWADGLFMEAEKLAVELTNFFPLEADTWINLFVIQQNLGKDKEALDSLKLGLKYAKLQKGKLLTEEIKLMFTIGEREYYNHHAPEAFKIWRKILDKAPYSIYSDLVKVYSLMDQYSTFQKDYKNSSERINEAQVILQQLKKKDYTFAKIYFLNGLIKLWQKDYNSALREFKWAYYMDNLDINNYYYLGTAYTDTGDTLRGRKIFRDILKININNDAAQTSFLESFKQTISANHPLQNGENSKKNINWKEQIIYFVLIDRFNDGDKNNNFNVDKNDPKGFHGGDIQGVIDKTDYLKSLGVTAVWLSPVFENREDKFYDYSAYHGYWVKDFFKVDKHFGTMEKLRELSDKLHSNGMYLILDMIVNHIDYDSDFVKTHPDWFHSYPSIINWDDQFQLENYKVTGLPDFAQENKDVKKFLFDMSKFWIDNINPDGFRLDAVKHVPISFWKEYNEEIRKYAGKDFLLLGEILHGDPNYCKKYFNNGTFGSLFDFPLYYTMIEVFANGKSAKQLGLRLYDDRKYNHPDMISPILDNHDVPRFITTCNGDINKMKMALSTMLTVRGIPTLYYGTEIALKGGDEPDNRRDMDFLNNKDITD